MKGETPTNVKASTFGKVWRIALLLCPIWAPVIFWPMVFWEAHITRDGPLNHAGLPLIFIVPALGAIPILISPGLHVVVKLFAVPLYYIAGLVVLGVWGLFVMGGWCQFLRYLQWHYC